MHNLFYKSICGEFAGVDPESVQECIENTLPIQEYSRKEIFNADETRLFYNLFPDKTFSVKCEICHGRKLSKLRLTVLLCTNSAGNEKITPLVVEKFKKNHVLQESKELSY